MTEFEIFREKVRSRMLAQRIRMQTELLKISDWKSFRKEVGNLSDEFRGLKEQGYFSNIREIEVEMLYSALDYWLRNINQQEAVRDSFCSMWDNMNIPNPEEQQ